MSCTVLASYLQTHPFPAVALLTVSWSISNTPAHPPLPCSKHLLLAPCSCCESLSGLAVGNHSFGKINTHTTGCQYLLTKRGRLRVWGILINFHIRWPLAIKSDYKEAQLWGCSIFQNLFIFIKNNHNEKELLLYITLLMWECCRR